VKVKIRIMIRHNRKILLPSEIHDIPKSQALLMIKNNFAEVVKKGDKISCIYCKEEIPHGQIDKHQEKCEKNPDNIDANDEIPPYEEWTKKELIAELEVRGIEFEKKAKKDELVELLESDDEDANEEEE